MSKFEIVRLEKYRIKAGWRDWLILKVTLKNGLVGWSEFTDSNGSVGTLFHAISEIEAKIIGIEFDEVMQLVSALRRKYRQSLPGIMWKAISALENALWDLNSQMSQKSIPGFFGEDGTNQKKSYKAYWSHCPTTRIRAANDVGAEPIVDYEGLVNLGQEIKSKNFSAFKTNLVSVNPLPNVYMPGFNKNFEIMSDALPDNYQIELDRVLKSITSKNKSLEIIIDMNFNVCESEFNIIQDMLKGKLIRWIEIDFDDWYVGQEYLKNTNFPICTGENILGLWNYMPIIMDDRIQIISIDLLWNGLSESVKIADEALKFGKKIAIHNYYGSLATSMALTFLSIFPSNAIELVEYDFDDVPWRDLIVSNPVTFEGGRLHLLPGLGWNNSLNLEVVKKYRAQ